MRLKRKRRVWAPEPDQLELACILVLLQGAFALLWAADELITGLVLGTFPILVPTLAATLATGVALLVLQCRLRRHSRLARRLVVWFERFVLLSAALDLLLALILAHRPFGLIPFLTQVLLPLTVLRLLRRTKVASPAVAPATP